MAKRRNDAPPAPSRPPGPASARPERLRRVVHGAGFTGLTQALIALSALALGIEAIPALGEPMAGWLDDFFALSTAWFVVEIVLRMVAHGRPLAGFFRSGWNLFDTVVVLLSLLPVAGGVAILARLLRLLRLLRLVSGSDTLRGFVEGRLPVGAHLLSAALLLALSIYSFAIAGFHLAGGVLAGAPAWIDLPNALASTLAWSAPLSPPALPTADARGTAWAVALALAHLAWLGLLLRGLLRARSRA
jgi:voltage-gated sodium channel